MRYVSGPCGSLSLAVATRRTKSKLEMLGEIEGRRDDDKAVETVVGQVGKKEPPRETVKL
jgi:hypothetical protein